MSLPSAVTLSNIAFTASLSTSSIFSMTSSYCLSSSLAYLVIASSAVTAVSGNTYVGTPFALKASFAASNDGPPIFTTIIGLSNSFLSSKIACAIPSGSADAVGQTMIIKLSTSS